MVSCFYLSGLMECHSCETLAGGGGGGVFPKSEFLNFKIYLFVY